MDMVNDLLTFIEQCPSVFHTVHTAARRLEEAGFVGLAEGSDWQLAPGGCYYTTRNGSSVIAFRIGEHLTKEPDGAYHFQLCASHSDSPTYKIKHVAELDGPGEYLRLNVEAYGGMIDSSWLDRPLSIAGRVLVKEADAVVSRLLYIDRDLLLIPSVAIHFNREVNQGYAYNRQVDLCPLFSAGALKKGSFDALLAAELGVEKDCILGKDLFLVNRQKGVVWGLQEEFVSSPKLDDLQCAYASLEAFLRVENADAVNVWCCFDNEEVGSNTKQGAMSTFLADVLQRIQLGLCKSPEAYFQAQARSFLVSCDNAHAVHPNHSEKTDAENCVFMNQGIVIKESANQKYTTDAFSRAVFTQLCQMADVPVQTFANRSDSAGGSTLGNLSNTQVSLHAVDIGLPQLAMHASYETAGTMDVAYAVRALQMFYQTDIQIEGSERIRFA